MEKFLKEWQTLIGSALGPFLAVIFGIVGFWIKNIISTKKEEKETLRLVEIAVTRNLDDTFKARAKLENFVSRLRGLIDRIRAETDDKSFSFESTNYPIIRDIYKNNDAPYFKVKSYYLHNKLLWVDAGTKEINQTISSLRHEFAELQRRNELLIALMRQSRRPGTAQQQRNEYASNLESFTDIVEKFVSSFIKKNIETMAQVKIYNRNLRKKNGFWFLWKNEGVAFKYFLNEAERKKFGGNLDSLERIDQKIGEEVKRIIEDAESRIR